MNRRSPRSAVRVPRFGKMVTERASVNPDSPIFEKI